MGGRGQVNGVGSTPEPDGWRDKIKAVPLDTRTRHQKFMGDPPENRSALAQQKREKENGRARTALDPRV
jgi:hypothetical protein